MEPTEPPEKRETSQKEKLAAWKQRKERKQRSQLPCTGSSRRNVSTGKPRRKNATAAGQSKPRSPREATAPRRPVPIRTAACKLGEVRGTKKSGSKDGCRGEQFSQAKGRDLNECMSALDAVTKARFLRVVASKQWKSENMNLMNRCVEEAASIETKRDALQEKKIRLEHIRYTRAVLARNKELQEFNFPAALELSQSTLEECSTALQQSSNRLYLTGATSEVCEQIADCLRDDL